MVAVCHCTHCQKTSGSAFSVNAVVPTDSFSVTGDYTIYRDDSDSGNVVERIFCPTCGSVLASRLSWGIVALKVGTLTSDEDVTPTVQGWMRSAKPWARDAFDVPGFEEAPTA